MTIRERLQTVQSAMDLHKVLHDMWAFGSPNWTFESTARYVPSHFWGALGRYFDEKGRLWERLPPSPVQQETGAPETEDGGVAERESPAREPASYPSLSELVDSFHQRLSAIRTRCADRPVAIPSHGADAELVAVAEPDINGSAANSEAVIEFPPASAQALCPICEEEMQALTAAYRGTAMCEPCVTLLKERG